MGSDKFWTDLAQGVIKKIETGDSPIGSPAGIDRELIGKALKISAAVGLTQLGVPATITPALVDTGVDAIKKLQDRLNVGGPKTGRLKALADLIGPRGARACSDQTEQRHGLDESGRAVKDNKFRSESGYVILYWIDKEFADRQIADSDGEVFTVRQLIRSAWSLWQREIEVFARDVSAMENRTERDANVIIKQARIDGPAGVLGRAHVGGKTITQQLTITLDENDNWTAVKFVAAACHEMGHILGLGHSTRSDQLMSPVIDLDHGIVTPQSEDKSRIVNEAKWPKAKALEEGHELDLSFPGADVVAEWLAKRNSPGLG